jgi:pimeloyl-ACP methyl ester carboxylesterase
MPVRLAPADPRRESGGGVAKTLVRRFPGRTAARVVAVALAPALAIAAAAGCEARSPRSESRASRSELPVPRSEPQAPSRVSFPTSDGGLVYGDLYGKGERGVVLAHGGRYNKESWAAQARALAAAGFRALAINFRGYGESRGPGQGDPLSAPLHLDVLAAVRYLRGTGARTVAVVGGSMGGGAAADASAEAEPGEIDRLVLLGSGAGRAPEKMAGRKLFIVARGDTTASGTPRLVGIQEQYDRTPEPKDMVILQGSAHAQFLFQTDQGERVMGEILRFLSAPSWKEHRGAEHERADRAGQRPRGLAAFLEMA